MGALDGKAIVITGSGRGLGAAFALHAAGEGAAIVVNDIESIRADATAEAICSAGGRAVAHPADITDWTQAQALVQRCIHEFGTLDGLVNNAAVGAIGAPEETTEEESRLLVEVNILGTMFCGTHAIRHMLSAGGGAIVNVTSGAQAGLMRRSMYAATKGAVASLTYNWAMELGDRGVRVNAFSPMASSQLAQDDVERYRSRWGHAPSGMLNWPNLPPPATNAPVVSYLLSDLAADLNGQVVRLDHGQISLMTHPGILYPPVIRENWNLGDVADAFREGLSSRSLPLGVHAFELTERELPAR